MLTLSDILLNERDLANFEDLVALVKARASAGEIFLAFDVRPPFADTPEDWEAQLEAVFTSAANVTPQQTDPR